MHPRKTGSANKKMSKFPRILDFIQAHHADLYSIFDDLALTSSLTPKRGAEGITFLLPDASYIKEIRKQTDGSDPEVATDMIFSLIIPLYLPDAKAWTAVQDDVPNLLGKKVEVSNVGASEIKLPKGTLTLDKKFKPFSRSGKSARGNMAVWDLKGVVDMKAPESSRKYTTKGGAAKRRRVTGRGVGNYDQVDAKLRSFVRDIDSQELRAMGEKNPGEPCRSVKLRVLANYHKYVKARADKGDEEAKKHLDYFRNVLDMNCSGGVEAAFYLTFCCRDSEDRQGLNNTLFLSETLESLTAEFDKPLDYLNKVNDEKRGGADNNTFDVEVVIDNLSWGVRARSAKDIVNAYNEYASKMGECPTKHRYQSIPNLKLLIDEFKFMCVHGFKNTIRCGNDATSNECRRNYSEFLESLSGFSGVGGDIIINNPNVSSQILKWSMDGLVDATRVKFMKDFLTEPDGMLREARRTVGGNDSDDVARYLPASNDYANPGMKNVSPSTMAEIRNYMDSHGGELPKF